MTALDELVELFGPPPARELSPDDWTEVEDYVGSALPGDFKKFLDAYGTGVICEELVVFHSRGSSPLLARMQRISESFGQSWRRDSDEYPFRFHPEPASVFHREFHELRRSVTACKRCPVACDDPAC